MTFRTQHDFRSTGSHSHATAGARPRSSVLNWQGYGTDLDWAVEEFAEATGHDVVHEYFNSEQEMLTKLRTNPGAYDVVMINAAFTPQAREEGLIAPRHLRGSRTILGFRGFRADAGAPARR